MATAKQQVDQQRQMDKEAVESQYFGEPPSEAHLVKMRLVIPGEHLVPKALHDLRVLDDVRKAHSVWITRDPEAETCLDIHAGNVTALQTALQAINWKIHNMRLSEESLTTQYFVQPASTAAAEVLFETEKRPVLKCGTKHDGYPSHAIDSLSGQLCKQLPQSFKTLVALPCLSMNISFGHLRILAKKKSTGRELSFIDFEAAMRQYSSRGRGAAIQTEFPHFEMADSLVSSILGNGEIAQKGATYFLDHRLEFAVGKKTVCADLPQSDGQVKAASLRCFETERCPPMDWMVSSPDMAVDWNLRVDSRQYDHADHINDANLKLAESFLFVFKDAKVPCNSEEAATKKLQHFKLPMWLKPSRYSDQDVGNVQLKSSVRLQYRDTPFEIKVTVTQHWNAMPSGPAPERLSWSVSVHGVNWDEALNERKSGEVSSHGFGIELSQIWPGGSTLEERLAEFLECVLLTQAEITKLTA